MKKIIALLFVPILLTGCLNGNKDFETSCSKTEESEGFIEQINYKIYSNNSNNITKVVETYNLTYNNEYGKTTFDAAKQSLKSYGESKQFTVEVIKDSEKEYEVNFTLNISKLKDSELKEMNFKRYYYDQMNVYKQDMTCSKR